MQARLAATDLACRRGERLLFRKLDFALGAGDMLQLRGPNGVGKTSLLRILAGLARPFAGSVERVGEIGLVDDRLALDEERTLGAALRFWARIDECDSISGAVEATQIGGLLDIPVRFLSTGQRKRAVLARLLFRPRGIWLLDEPFSGLDVDAQEKLAKLIAQHCEDGGLCLFVSHQSVALDAPALDLADFAA